MKKILTVIGAVAAGFAAGVLTAPKSGKETRSDIKKRAVKLKKEAENNVTKAAAATKDSVGSLKSGSSKVGEAVVETAKEVRGNVEKRFAEKK